MCFSLLLWAAAFLRIKLAKQLIEKDVDVHIDQSDSCSVQTSQSDWIVGLQPIHVAARVGSKELCEVFLNNGAIVSDVKYIILYPVLFLLLGELQ